MLCSPSECAAISEYSRRVSQRDTLGGERNDSRNDSRNEMTIDSRELFLRYGVATVRMIDKIIDLFCKRAL